VVPGCRNGHHLAWTCLNVPAALLATTRNCSTIICHYGCDQAAVLEGAAATSRRLAPVGSLPGYLGTGWCW
jgi:hypothetical protein